MTAVLTLRSKTAYAGGILTGLGLSAYGFGLYLWWMMHHMFIVGISKPRIFMAIVLLPAAVIATGVWLASSGSKNI